MSKRKPEDAEQLSKRLKQESNGFLECGRFVLWRILHLSGRDAVLRLSQTCSALRQVTRRLWTRMLSAQQQEVVAKLLTLRPTHWQSRVRRTDREKFSFPSEYVLSTGPGTGKTLMALAFASALFQQWGGNRVFIAVPLKLCAQWQREHAKFADWNEFPPLRFVDLTERSVDEPHLDSVTLVARDHLHCKAAQRRFFSQHWDVGLFDEASHIPKTIVQYSREHPSFFAVSFNASKGARANANYLTDSELGALPDVVTEVACQRRLDRDAVRLLIEQYQTEKTLVLSDCKWPLTQHNILSDFTDLPNITRLSGLKRTRQVERFATDPEQHVLLAPLTYMSKGFNLHCDTVLVFSGRRIREKLLLQLRGRLRRVGTPYRTVYFRIFQQDSIGPVELSFHALALTETQSSALLRLCTKFDRFIKWSGKGEMPWGARYAGGGTELTHPRRPITKSSEILEFFRQFAPSAHKRVSEFSELRLRVA